LGSSLTCDGKRLCEVCVRGFLCSILKRSCVNESIALITSDGQNGTASPRTINQCRFRPPHWLIEPPDLRSPRPLLDFVIAIGCGSFGADRARLCILRSTHVPNTIFPLLSSNWPDEAHRDSIFVEILSSSTATFMLLISKKEHLHDLGVRSED
jgi:hypothetical protein